MEHDEKKSEGITKSVSPQKFEFLETIVYMSKRLVRLRLKWSIHFIWNTLKEYMRIT